MSEGPDYVATMDQLGEMVGPLAKVMYRYYFALLVEGFPVEQAFTLTLGYQTSILSGRKG
jgi:hypothetical protein